MISLISLHQSGRAFVTAHGRTPQIVEMNQTTYDTLTADLQRIYRNSSKRLSTVTINPALIDGEVRLT